LQPKTVFNLPNQLTLLRVALSLVFAVVFYSNLPYGYTVAFLIFIAAGITDMFDGKIARSRHVETDFGKLMDPLADKILNATAFISFVGLQETGVAAWMVVLIISREFLITGLRLLAMGKGKLIDAGIWGKHKTVSQIVAICVILSFLSIKEFLLKSPELWGRWQDSFVGVYGIVVFWMMMIVVGLTLLSGILYIWENRRLFQLDNDA
jgi:CDP-diacylglycerol---glycerol-3-phosphate 3-phosphatidyltransferase